MMMFSLLVSLPYPSSSSLSPKCTFFNNTDFYIPGQSATGHADTAKDCCALCRGATPFFVFAVGPKECYCACVPKRISLYFVILVWVWVFDFAAIMMMVMLLLLLLLLLFNYFCQLIFG